MKYSSYQEYLRKQREAYAKEGKSFDFERQQQLEKIHKEMKKHLPTIRSEEDLYFNNMD